MKNESLRDNGSELLTPRHNVEPKYDSQNNDSTASVSRPNLPRIGTTLFLSIPAALLITAAANLVIHSVSVLAVAVITAVTTIVMSCFVSMRRKSSPNVPSEPRGT